MMAFTLNLFIVIINEALTVKMCVGLSKLTGNTNILSNMTCQGF